MSVFAIGSVRASPGVTTTSLVVAACLRDRLLVEADCDGGVLALRYGLDAEPGLTTLAAAGEPRETATVSAHTQMLPGAVPVLVGPDAPDEAVALWRSAGDRLGRVLSDLGRDVVVDCGRLSPTAPLTPLLSAASRVLVVARPRAEELVPVARRLPALRRVNPSVALVLVGDRPYAAPAVAADVDCEVAGVVADDPRAARVLTRGGPPGALDRSALARTATTLAEALVAGEARPESPESTVRSIAASTEMEVGS